MAYVPEHRIARFVTVLSIVIAVILLFLAIVTLYLLSHSAAKIATLGAYMLVFASSVGLFTSAKRSEVFAATAA